MVICDGHTYLVPTTGSAAGFDEGRFGGVKTPGLEKGRVIQQIFQSFYFPFFRKITWNTSNLGL